MLTCTGFALSPTRARRIPSVLTKAEVVSVLGAMDGELALLAKLLYGTGMRLMLVADAQPHLLQKI